MGPKITVDSATMMNKGLEVLEAAWLFDVPIQDVSIVIHRESIVHSLIELVDGSVKAQLSLPDMRLPIQFALSYPDRFPAPLPTLDLARLGTLSFAEVDRERFRCAYLAIDAGRLGDSYPTVMNAANEVAVELFLAGMLRFDQIRERDRGRRRAARPDPRPEPGGGLRRRRLGPRREPPRCSDGRFLKRSGRCRGPWYSFSSNQGRRTLDVAGLSAPCARLSVR